MTPPADSRLADSAPRPPMSTALAHRRQNRGAKTQGAPGAVDAPGPSALVSRRCCRSTRSRRSATRVIRWMTAAAVWDAASARQFPYGTLQDGSKSGVLLFQQPADVFAVFVRLTGVTHFASSFLTDHQCFSLRRPWCTRRQERRPSPPEAAGSSGSGLEIRRGVRPGVGRWPLWSEMRRGVLQASQPGLGVVALGDDSGDAPTDASQTARPALRQVVVHRSSSISSHLLAGHR